MVIFDTNVLVSAALLSGSRADLCLRTVLSKPAPLIFSSATYEEIADVLMRPKFDHYVARQSREALLRTWKEAGVFIPDGALREAVCECRDSDDDKFLELALASGAVAILTGDPDLLSLDPWRGIRIVKLQNFESVVLPLIGISLPNPKG
jgi:putative PIN family toxin of toxin-antitoxin system